MNLSDPLVTVIATCYNHANYVEETLDSIYSQSYSNLQVVIIDDCSQDDSVPIIKNWLKNHDVQWTFFENKKNIGVTRTLNRAKREITGDYCKIISCDDILIRDCIKNLVTALSDTDEDVGLVYADVNFIDSNSIYTGKTQFSTQGWRYGDVLPPSGKIFYELALGCFIPATSVLFKSKILREFSFDENLYFEDWDFWLRISKMYHIVFLNSAVVNYRIHSESMFQKKNAKFRDAELRTAKKHLGFNNSADLFLTEFIYEKSILAYMESNYRSTYWLFQRFLIRKSLSNFLHVLISILGISYKQKEKCKSLLRSL